MHHCHSCNARISTINRILVTITEVGATSTTDTVTTKVVCNKTCLTNLLLAERDAFLSQGGEIPPIPRPKGY